MQSFPRRCFLKLYYFEATQTFPKNEFFNFRVFWKFLKKCLNKISQWVIAVKISNVKILNVFQLDLHCIAKFVSLEVPCFNLFQIVSGAAINMIGGLLRVAALYMCDQGSTAQYIVLFVGQTIAAIAQALILIQPTKLAAYWFGPDERTLANSLGTSGRWISSTVECWYELARAEIEITLYGKLLHSSDFK